MSIELEDIDIITTDDISNTKQTTHELVTLEPITSVELKGPYTDSDDTYSISERSDTVSDNTDSAEAIKHSTSINHLQVTVHETDLHGTTKVTAAVNNDDEEDEKDDDYKSKSNIDTTPSTIVLANLYNETHLKQNYNKKKWFNLLGIFIYAPTQENHLISSSMLSSRQEHPNTHRPDGRVVLRATPPIIHSLSKQALRDQITNLPGSPPVSFSQYAGYITINNTSHASIFYWFQECELGLKNCPLFLWTNGGPGCSGLLGALTEQGAFRNEANGSLSLNEWRWNQIVNIVFIEQPIGVGFSYSDDINDYNVNGDERSAMEMYQFLLAFYDIFPELKPLPFYISTESYGGHYGPTFAKYIVDHDTQKSIHFKGLLIGNPLIDQVSNEQGHFGTFFGHQMISRPLFMQWIDTCDDGRNTNQTCQELKHAMSTQAGNIFTSALDFPVCLSNSTHSVVNYYRHYAWRRAQYFEEKIFYGVFGNKKPDHYTNYYDPNPPYKCLQSFTQAYLNRIDVKEAIHAKTNITWGACNWGNTMQYNNTDVAQPMQPVIEYLVNGAYDLKFTIYSGDDDTVCATASLQQWIWNMSWSVEQPWSAWYYNDSMHGLQLGGYQVKFENAITVITVHTAGHEVPFFRPHKALRLLQNFLEDE